ncbi:hypothetical protein SAMN05216436_115116 [bacterium A37T11]|nr:hypothetical protein SAMN05216436_115116 [bacterium A37T11]
MGIKQGILGLKGRFLEICGFKRFKVGFMGFLIALFFLLIL